MFYCDKFCLVITYILETMLIQNHEYNTRSKKATNFTNTLSKIENDLMTYQLSKNEIINLKEVIIKKLQDGICYVGR